MSGVFGEYDQVLPSIGFSKSEEKILSSEIQDIDSFNDETFGEGCEEDDWESSHEKMAQILESRSSVDDSKEIGGDSFAKSISHLIMENDEPEDPAIMTYGRKEQQHPSKMPTFFGCNSPILNSSSNKNIWGVTSTPTIDSGLSLLKSLNSDAISRWNASPNSSRRPKTMEEVENEMFASSQKCSASSWEHSPIAPRPNMNPFIGSSMHSPYDLEGWLSPIDQAEKNMISENWDRNKDMVPSNELKGAQTVDEVERKMRQLSSSPRTSQMPIGTPRMNKFPCSLPSGQFVTPNIHMGQSSPHLAGGANHLPPHPILNPQRSPFGVRPPPMMPHPFLPNKCLPNRYPMNLNQDNDHMSRQKYIVHPLLQKSTKRVSEYNMYNFQNYGYNQHGAIGLDRNEDDYDYDEYSGLMTQKEKEWLVRIQMMQLQTNNPYLDDYYYTTLSSKRLARVKEVVIPETSKHEIKTYEPTQFEGSLGKLQAISINYPRKVLDLSVRAVNEEASSNSFHALRRALQAIEKMYTMVLEIEDEDKRMLALPNEAHEPHLATKASFISRLYSGLSIAINNNNPSSMDIFAQIMSVRKGRNLFIRSLPFFGLNQQVNLIESLMGCLPVVLKKDSSDQVLLTTGQIIFDIIDRCSMKELLQLAERLVSCKDPSNILASNPFGQKLIQKILRNGESASSTTSNDNQHKWEALTPVLRQLIDQIV